VVMIEGDPEYWWKHPHLSAGSCGAASGALLSRNVFPEGTSVKDEMVNLSVLC
jgi:hypothetical protein